MLPDNIFLLGVIQRQGVLLGGGDGNRKSMGTHFTGVQ
jgi:hypothetical protein